MPDTPFFSLDNFYGAWDLLVYQWLGHNVPGIIIATSFSVGLFIWVNYEPGWRHMKNLIFNRPLKTGVFITGFWVIVFCFAYIHNINRNSESNFIIQDGNEVGRVSQSYFDFSKNLYVLENITQADNLDERLKRFKFKGYILEIVGFEENSNVIINGRATNRRINRITAKIIK